ncbi:hypothetical protein PY365_09510 [Roseiarcaceae bacterium H3SJ34-1]|uniref:hypothetical protein n=1 Tax=Terripilifer ovatus TaxID=3032367 RepID=UPI003AB9B17D|nr:hypothetical protein [Roseiarcaceae bacterium H3SJ34-1]
MTFLQRDDGHDCWDAAAYRPVLLKKLAFETPAAQAPQDEGFFKRWSKSESRSTYFPVRRHLWRKHPIAGCDSLGEDEFLEHDPKSGNRFSEKIMLKQNTRA